MKLFSLTLALAISASANAAEVCTVTLLGRTNQMPKLTCTDKNSEKIQLPASSGSSLEQMVNVIKILEDNGYQFRSSSDYMGLIFVK
jgi:hypothetical protein